MSVSIPLRGIGDERIAYFNIGGTNPEARLFPSPCGELVMKVLEGKIAPEKLSVIVSIPLRGIGDESFLN